MSENDSMITWIGLCAGEVWRYLDAHDGESSMKTLMKEINAPEATILMAVGWLGREGHVLLRGKGASLKVILNSRR